MNNQYDGNGGMIRPAGAKLPRKQGLFAAAFAMTLAAFTPADSRASDVHAISNVTIVDLRGGVLRPGQTVVWHRSRILAAGPTATVSLPPGTRLMAGEGRFLLPGFWDMHVHISTATPDDPELTLPLFIANGVTSVRDMSDDLDAADHPVGASIVKRRLDAQSRAGLRSGPRIVALASHMIDGPAMTLPAGAPEFLAAGTPEHARTLVHYLRDEASTDFLKVYSNIPRSAYFAMMDEAKQAGLVVAGHKPLAVSFIEAADAGQKSIEHAREILFDSALHAQELRQTLDSRNPSPAQLRGILQKHDPMRLQEIFAALVRNDTFYVPTHLTRLFDWKAAANDRAYLEDRRIHLLHPNQFAHALQDAATTRARVSSMDDVRTYEAFFRKGLEVTRKAYEAGVKIMVGTDAGDSWCFHGSSLHDEMELLAQAGLPPLAVLRAATVVPAEFAGKLAEHGAVAAGYVADLLLLNENPLTDIRATREIQAVVFNGRVFNRGALDALKAEVAGRAMALRSDASHSTGGLE